MDLTRSQWLPQDVPPFLAYLATFGKGEEKARWEQRVLQTALPCLAVPCQEVDRVVRAIAKGNYAQFVDLWIADNHTAVVIRGKLICRLPATEALPRLLRYAQEADSWASIDALGFRFGRDFDLYRTFAKECLASVYPFVRRLGLIILLKQLSADNVADTLAHLPPLVGESHYYVNMAAAWLVAECFAKNRVDTLLFLDSGRYNAFVANKAVSKCRDSWRISDADKQRLLQYKRREN